ncbi:hypothetical protein DM828_27925 [Pseudomonas umsongensis]|nr:hypothetical protein [Pseudomonas umsongensis]
MWRGDLSPLECAALPLHYSRRTALTGFATASQPSGDKSPRHNELPFSDHFPPCRKRTFTWRA